MKISPISLLFSLCWLLYVIWLASISVLFLILFFVVFSSQPFVRNFPHFLCTVCKIVVCSQHSFQFKEFNSQSASLTNSSRSPFKFPQPKHGCFMVFHKLFHGLALFIFFISFRFSQMCLLVYLEILYFTLNLISNYETIQVQTHDLNRKYFGTFYVGKHQCVCNWTSNTLVALPHCKEQFVQRHR